MPPLSSASAAERAHARPVVVLRDVAKRYSNGMLALSALSLSVKRGEFVSLLGPSGCGKSTALRIIAGLAAPSSGTVDWPSSRLTHQGRPDGDIAFVFQEPTLMPWADTFANVYLPLRLRGVSRSAARDDVMAALAAVGLADVSTAFPRELSGGMKMRVSIARAFVTKPTLLLMDEPFAALDEITRQRLNDDLLRLWEETGTTIVFVTHSVFESSFLSSRIIVMKARPGQVASEIDLPVPSRRDPRFRLSEAYRAQSAKVSEALETAMWGGDGNERN